MFIVLYCLGKVHIKYLILSFFYCNETVHVMNIYIWGYIYTLFNRIILQNTILIPMLSSKLHSKNSSLDCSLITSIFWVGGSRILRCLNRGGGTAYLNTFFWCFVYTVCKYLWRIFFHNHSEILNKKHTVYNTFLNFNVSNSNLKFFLKWYIFNDFA